MAKREFLQLAHVWKQAKHGIAGYYMSEKLDGMRCLWDGGITRGMLCSEVPWANTEKHSRFVTPPKSTGMWTRYGQPLHAPEWFLDSLPKRILDGELYAGLGNFQKVTSAVKKHVPIDNEWLGITYVIFDTPNPFVVFGAGEIKNTNFKKVLRDPPAAMFENVVTTPKMATFSQRHQSLLAMQDHEVGDMNNWEVHEQRQLPRNLMEAVHQVEMEMLVIEEKAGEGLILKSPSNLYLPERTHEMLKVKQCQDAEGTVVNYIWGKKTDLGSKLLGLMGGLVLKQDNGRELEISGFTNEEREMTSGRDGVTPLEEGTAQAGKKVAWDFENKNFPRGSRITYKFRELTDDGVAKEARYWRRA